MRISDWSSDVCSSDLPHPPGDLTQLGAIRHDDEVDREAVDGPRLGRPDDGHQRSSGSNQACGPLLDVAADDVENQIDVADVLPGVILKVDEIRTEERRVGEEGVRKRRARGGPYEEKKHK